MKRRHFIGSLATLCSTPLLASCTSYEFQSATKPTGLSTDFMVEKINEVRRANRRKPITYNKKLEQAAQFQARKMASRGELSHNLGETLRERTDAAGYVGAVAENVAGGHKTLEAAIEGWLQSPTHRSALLSDKFTEFGLAVQRVPEGQKSRYPIFWALVMGGDFDLWL